MAVKNEKRNSPNAYDNRPSAQFSRGGMPPIIPNRRPLSREQILQQQKNRVQLDKKRQAVSNRKDYYRSQAEPNKRKKKVDPNKQYRLDKEKRIRKGRDYFYVMRKVVCFVLFLLFAANIALFALSYLQVLGDDFNPFIAFFVEPDYTPVEERISEEVDDEIIDYQDQSVYFTFTDPIFGFIKKMTGKDLGLGESPKYDEMMVKVEYGMADSISPIVITYFPIAMILLVIIALISTIKAFLAMFGKRVYRLFGLNAILMLIFTIIVIIGGVASNMRIEQALDFSQIVPFLTAGILPVADASVAPTTAAGFGLLALLILPIIILILSFFTKKKVPYSIFD